MIDELEPFRAEFKRCCDVWEAAITPKLDVFAAKSHVAKCRADPAYAASRYEFYWWKRSEMSFAMRAAKILHIAETEGPAKALLWKLAN